MCAMLNLDDVRDQIQEDITSFTKGFSLLSSSVVTEICDIVRDRINEYKKTKEDANAKFKREHD